MARAAGDGAIYPDRDRHGRPRWRGAVVVGYREDPETGARRPIRRTVTGRTKTDVARRLRALVAERDAGRTAWDAAPTVHEWLDHWLDKVARPNVEPLTWESYEVVVRRFKAWVGPRRRLDELTPEDIEDLYAAMADDGGPALPPRSGEGKPRKPAKPLSATTIRMHHVVLSGALDVAVKRERLHRNPFAVVEPPPAVAYNARYPSLAQTRAILATARARGEFARWALALYLGPRQGEVLGLAREDLDLDEHQTIRFRQKVYRARGEGLRVGRTKSDRERNLPLPATLVDALREHLATVRRARMAAGPRWVGYRTDVDGEARDIDLVFPNRVGRPRSREDDWAAWHALLKAAGVPPVRLHDTRVAFGTYAAQAGVHPKVAAELMGHADESLTLGIYTKVPTEVAREAVDAIAALIEATG